MTKFEITFHKGNSDIYSANIAIAKSAEQATAYYTAEGYEVIGCNEFHGMIKPGQPITEIPEDWEPETEESTEETENTDNGAYLDLITSTEKQGTRTLYHIGDRFTIEAMTVTHDLNNAHDLMNLWQKHGYITEKLTSHISIETYYTDEAGCWGKYNITEKTSDDGKRRVINFDYLREATPENELELVAECIKLAVEDNALDLPILTKQNAKVGGIYAFAGGSLIVQRIYRLTEEEAQECDYMYLDRVTTTAGDFALTGSDIYKKAI